MKYNYLNSLKIKKTQKRRTIMKKSIIISLVLIIILATTCKKESEAPQIYFPKKSLVIIANFSIQNQPSTDIFSCSVDLMEETGFIFATLNSQCTSIEVKDGLLNELYEKTILGTAEYKYFIEGQWYYGQISPRVVHFIAKDTVILNFSCQP